MGLLALGHSHHAERGASGTLLRATDHLVDVVHGGIDLARQPVASITLALDLHTEVRHFVAERRRRLQVDRVPTDLEERATARVGVRASHIRRPVSVRVLRGAPDTGSLGSISRRVDIVAKIPISMTSRTTVVETQANLLSSSLTPISRIRHRKGRQLLHQRRDQHRLVSGQNGLTDGDISALAFVAHAHGPRAVLAVGPIRERLLDLAVLVAVQSTILYQSVYIQVHEAIKLKDCKLTIDIG